MPADEVAAQAVADGQRAFQIHRAARPQLAEIGSQERFRAGLEGKRLLVAVDHRQAATVDRNAIGHARFGGDFRLADDQTAARRLPAKFRDLAKGFDDS